MTRSHRGLGLLGLAITRHIVEAHQGTIEARSDGRGKGALFSVRLPRQGRSRASADGRHDEPVESTRTGALSLAGISIVCIDDDPSALELLELALRSRGGAVRTARSVDEAMEVIPVLHPDVIVTDMAMSKRDGHDLVADIRLQGPLVSKTPVIALTAHTRLQDQPDARGDGFDGVLAKPVDIEATIAAIRDLVAPVTLRNPYDRSESNGFDK